MSDIWSGTHCLEELVAAEDEWLVRQARSLGLTVEELAERYEIERWPLVVELVADENDTLSFRAIQRLRLRRRETGDSERSTP